MNKCIKLSDMKVGQYAIIKENNLQGAIRRRVIDIGLINGTCIKCIQKARGGSPIAFCVRGAVIAVRKSDADKIKVIPCSGGAL